LGSLNDGGFLVWEVLISIKPEMLIDDSEFPLTIGFEEELLSGFTQVLGSFGNLKLPSGISSGSSGVPGAFVSELSISNEFDDD
jgi:hypothetical protein